MAIRSKVLLLFRLPFAIRNWWTYFFNRFGYVAAGTVTYRLRGGASLVVRTRTSDTLVFNDIWMGGVYDSPLIDWKSTKTVIDVGAHIGIFALFALRKNPSASIIACEPEPSNVELLNKNVLMNSLEFRVLIEPQGIAEAPGVLKLNVMPNRGECNSLYRQTEHSYSMEVPVTTLPDIFSRHSIEQCDLLKMNCEGAEYQIFYSLSEGYFRRIKAMLINYHFYSPDPRHHPAALRKHLEKMGFTVRKNAKDIFIALRT